MTDADTPRVPDQPDGISDDSFDLPDKQRAAERVNEFLAWYGDGRLYPCVQPGTEDEMPPLFARDLQALANVVLRPPADAVKLGDVEAAHRAQRIVEERCTRVARELDDLKDEIGEIVDAYPNDHICERIRAVIERNQVDG